MKHRITLEFDVPEGNYEPEQVRDAMREWADCLDLSLGEGEFVLWITFGRCPDNDIEVKVNSIKVIEEEDK